MHETCTIHVGDKSEGDKIEGGFMHHPFAESDSTCSQNKCVKSLDTVLY